jgi:hypothetical protein
MAIMSSRLIRHEICKDELKKMGARVLDIQGIMYYVKFDLEGHAISYMYHLKDDNSFYMERIKPYTMPLGDYENEEEIVDVIRVDIEQFRNAMRSKNFDRFITIDDHISTLVRLFEDLFLYYNIDKEDLDQLDDRVNGVLETILRIMDRSNRVYKKKDPEVLREQFDFKR